MIIGNGQLAKAFSMDDKDNVCFMASGVSDSNCTSLSEFNREEALIERCLRYHSGMKLVYFSSCALSADDYELNAYYTHKSNMESLIVSGSSNYLIIRVPQLFGALKRHATLINFLFFNIVDGNELVVNELAYRYVLDIKDLKSIVTAMIESGVSNQIVDVANPHRYSVLKIVKLIESLTGFSAKYSTIERPDSYFLKFDSLFNVVEDFGLEVDFSDTYLEKRLESRVSDYFSQHL